MAAGLLGEYVARRTALVATAIPGTRAAGALSDLTDETVSALAGAASSAAGARFALFATGGYGARRLLPHSDIDLLIISHGDPRELESVVRGVVYPLWDAGLVVGHQVRSPTQHVRAIGEDIENLTTFLTARLVAGDPALADRVLAMAFQRVRKLARRAARSFLERERPGSPYLLEPDLKHGAGGQRDIDELVWHAAMHAGTSVSDAAPLVGAGLLTADERDALGHAQEAITAARWAIHASSERARHTMTLDDAALPGVDADAVQRALETVHHTLLCVRERLAGIPEHPAPPLDLQGLRRAAAVGPEGLPALERLAREGAFDGIAPRFSEMMPLRRPALSHRVTVGAHSLHALAILGAARDTDTPSAVHDALLVAALTHDVGKRDLASGHAARGAVDAADAARRLGLTPRTAWMATTLVREHLLLTDIALHADTSDEDVVLAAAARLGDRSLVAPLFRLTEADMRATGPDVWTPWRATMIADLAAKIDAALSPEIDGAGIVHAAERTRAEAIRRSSAVGASRTVLAFCEQAPLRYLADRSAQQVIRDARLVQSLAGPGRTGEFALDAVPEAVPGTWRLDIVTRDRPGLFATLAGVIALAGLDVLAAEAYTAANAIAVDSFVVASATRADADERTWTTLRSLLDDAIASRIDIEVRLAERRRHYPSRARSRVTPRVRAGARGAFSTALRVEVPDRVGLLHDLAHVIDRAGFDIRRAAITTADGVARDTFELADAEGAPPGPAELDGTLVPQILETVATSWADDPTLR